MKKLNPLFLLLLPCFIMAQSTDRNYVKTTTYKDSVTTSIPNPTAAQAIVNVMYFDGLERPSQLIYAKQSDIGKDIVVPIAYDAIGRQAKEYLPYQSDLNMLYDVNAITNAASYYSSQYGAAGVNPFSEKIYEASPLNRVLEQAAPGQAWANDYPAAGTDHTIKFSYQYNTNTSGSPLNVKLFKAVAHPSTLDASGYYITSLTNSTGTVFYPFDKLYRTIVRDENSTGGNPSTQEFRNLQGQLILQRSSLMNDTYYVYDQFGNLAYVIPPAAPANLTPAVRDAFCYQYRYDAQNRLVEKKLPGKNWEYIVYDTLDRIVATGPANSPFSDLGPLGWLVTKYDVFDRPVITAWIPFSTTTRKALQDTLDLQTTNLSESKSASDNTGFGIPFRYTNVAYPTTGYQVLTVNYYDDYVFTGAPTTFSTVEGQIVYYNNTTKKPKGLLTGSVVRVPQASTNTLKETTYLLYDYMGRAIQAKKTNYLTGSTQLDVKLDFSGKTLYTVNQHKRTSGSAVLYTRNDFSYTDQDRLNLHTHKIGSSGTPQLMSKKYYNSLGELISQGVGGTSATGTTSLQRVDYSYNIRGWLTAINDVNGTETPPANVVQGSNPYDLFRFKINYETISDNLGGAVKALYNGNISETSWRTFNDDVVRRYSYKYDPLNRLLDAYYQKPADATPLTGSYNESAMYDMNGNILTMDRTGDLDVDATVITIDDMTYTPELANTATTPNRMRKIEDASSDTSGFIDGTAGNPVDYTYDIYGNLKTDTNKGITDITYNHLNLPLTITLATGSISYLYNAFGEKVKKTVVSGGMTTVTDYLDGFQYEAGVLQFFPTAQGYVSATTISGVTTYKYAFHYWDHLGNVRLTYGLNSLNQVTIMEEDNYYPFGMKHKGYNSTTLEYGNTGSGVGLIPCTDCNYKYKFNDKEFQNELGLNVTAMDYRQYDSTVGRFNGMDPLAEWAYDQTPNHFGFNNPVVFSDPSGLWPDPGRTIWNLLFGNWVGRNKDYGGGRSGDTAGGGDNDKWHTFPVYEYASNTYYAGSGRDSSFDSVRGGGGGGYLAPPKGTKVMEDITKQSFLERMWAKTIEDRTWSTDSGLTFMVNDDGTIGGIKPLGGAGIFEWIGGGGAAKAAKTGLKSVGAAAKGFSKMPKGFKEVKDFGYQHGQKVYKYKGKFYSRDIDGHNGGVWKVFENVGGRLKRLGTADHNLNIFKN